MKPAQAFAPSGFSAVRADQSAAAASPRAHAIDIEVIEAAQLQTIEDDWNDLLARADAPNLFMDPALVRAAANVASGRRHCTLLAWKANDDKKQLMGLWAFAISRPHHSALPFRVLIAPSSTDGYLSTPVIDRTELDATLHAMLDALATHPRLPKIIALDMMAMDGPTMAALSRVLTARGSTYYEFERHQRPKLASDLDGKAYLEKALSSSTRKKLRQHRRRLAEKGTLTYTQANEPEAVRQALATFLTMEAAGWKGRRGTALLCDAVEASFMREAVSELAERGRVAIHALELDGRPVSMQIIARSGRAAFTWKTTYDEQLGDYSPGMLLFEDYTAALLNDRTIAYVDSCSYDDSGYMSAWTDRQPVADIWLDTRRGGSLEFQMLTTLQRFYHGLRGAAKSTYLKLRQRHKR